MANKILSAFLITLYLLSNGCSGTKFLKDGEYLVRKNSVEYTTKNKSKTKEITEDLLELATPKPNSGFLKFPLKIYRFTSNRKEKGFKNYLHKNFSEEPSLYNDRKVEISQLKMNKYLLDNGYIGSHVSVDTTHKKRSIDINYSISLQKRHTINKITPVSDTTEIGQLLIPMASKSKLIEGEFYSKSNLDAERERLSTLLRNVGYINITDENFFFTVDTQFVNNIVDISINYKPTTIDKKPIQYQLGTTYIHSLSDNSNTENVNMDTLFIKPGMYLIEEYPILKPKILDITIDQDSSDYISIERQKLTTNHFVSYGIFKFVNQKYSDPYGDSLNIMDRHIYLTPGSDASIGAEFELNNRSGNFFGAAITSTFSNNNAFKGAEIFNIDLTLGSELQFNNNQSLLNTFTGDLNIGLAIPRLLVPFVNIKPSTFHIPYTKLSISNIFENRLESYTALRSTFSFSYEWRETRKSNHLLSPLSITYLNLLATSAIFKERLDEDIRLANSLQDIIDLGTEYTYTFTDQSQTRSKNYSYLILAARASGNTLSALIQEENTEGQKVLFNTPFSQYAKVSADYRYYVLFRKSQLVSRINAGIAYAYGNADEVPYSEQFFVGGSQSMRGFNIRGLGPGNYVLRDNPNNVVENQFYDQTGDIILEMNLEYRFRMVGFLKGAVFVDAGNVWLAKNNIGKPGGLFKVDTFLDQIAINTGYGFRLDFDFLLIRFDLGLVLRRPYFNEGFDWTYNRTDAFNDDWWDENLNVQIGIGYPF